MITTTLKPIMPQKHYPKDRLRQLLPPHLALPFEPRFEVALGVPAEGISRIAVEYQSDVVVLAAHAADPIEAHQHERTAYRVIRWSHCPVLTISTTRPSSQRS